MKISFKCSGVIDNKDVVNCPLISVCVLYNATSIGVEQQFIKPDAKVLAQVFICHDFIEMKKCCGNWDEYGKCTCN